MRASPLITSISGANPSRCLFRTTCRRASPSLLHGGQRKSGTFNPASGQLQSDNRIYRDAEQRLPHRHGRRLRRHAQRQHVHHRSNHGGLHSLRELCPQQLQSRHDEVRQRWRHRDQFPGWNQLRLHLLGDVQSRDRGEPLADLERRFGFHRLGRRLFRHRGVRHHHDRRQLGDSDIFSG